MVQTIVVAIFAGLGTALLSGLLVPGTMQAAILSLIAPAPLFIVGFGWHPYAAALAGLVAALSVQMAAGDPGALAVALLFALPAFAMTGLSERLFGVLSGRPDRDGIDLGRILLTLIVFVALVYIVAGLFIEPDYAILEQRIKRTVEFLIRSLSVSGGLPPVPAQDISRIADVMSSIMLPMMAMITIGSLLISAVIGLVIADRSNRLVFVRPDLRRFRLPGGSLILLGIALVASMRLGYVGLLGSIVGLGLLLALALQGLAVIHVRTIGMDARGLLLAAIWAATVFFWVPAILFAVIGMIDHITDFRRGRL